PVPFLAPDDPVLQVAQPEQEAVTTVLEAARAGEEAAFRVLFHRLDGELRRRAHVAYASHQTPTPNTTALVQEALAETDSVLRAHADSAGLARIAAVREACEDR